MEDLNYRQVSIRCDPFPFSILYQELGTEKQVKGLCKKTVWDDNFPWTPFNNLNGARAVTRMFGLNSCIWAHARTGRQEWRENMTHEIVHACINGLVGIGMGFTGDSLSEYGNDEPLCYLVQFVIKGLGVSK